MDERVLVKRAVLGEREAFAQLYALYKDRLYRYAYFKLGREPDAQDAVSDCVVKAFENIKSLRNEKAFPAWIFKILYRTCAEILSRRSTEQEREDIIVLADRADNSSEQLAPELSEALNILKSEDRDIVLLAVIAGYNSREIAKITGIKPSTVRSRLSSSLEKMREFLE